MIKVTSSPSSVTVRDTNTQTTVAVRIANSIIEFHQSINGKDGGAAQKVQKELTNIVRNKIDKKLAYKQRFDKLAKAISGMDGADSFQKVFNRLQKIETLS